MRLSSNRNCSQFIGISRDQTRQGNHLKKIIKPEPLSEIFEYRLTVESDVIDEMNHVGNLFYLKWTNRAGVAHSSHVGWTPQAYRDSGFGFIVRSHSIKYRVPAVLGDSILIQTWIASMERVSSVRKYRIVREKDGELLARAETNWVFVDLQSLKLTKIPESVSGAFVNRNNQS